MAQRSLPESTADRKPGRPRSQTPTKATAEPNNNKSLQGKKRKEAAETSATPVPILKRKRLSKPPPSKLEPVRPTVNELPNQRLDVFVFGDGSNAELGLGPDPATAQVKRPRLNSHLDAKKIGIVALACGVTHSLVVTIEGTVMSWGVNANGALGRNTEWRPSPPSEDDEDDPVSEDIDLSSGLNPYESTPTIIEGFPEGTKIVKVAAGESISLALADDGRVFGWGCFRNQTGIMGFYHPPSNTKHSGSKDENAGSILVQREPRLYSELKKIVDIVCGTNHAMALSQSGEIFVWGCGEQNQLGHHINERLDVEGKAALTPSPLRTGRRKYKAIFSGNEHSFAIDTKDQILAWGLNNFGATGVDESAGGTDSNVYVPTVVDSLSNPNDPVRMLCGGQFHSLAITRSGKCLAFGRFDGLQLGIETSGISEENIIFDGNKPARPRILIEPTPVLDIGKIKHAACGATHSIIINEDGEAYSWGVGSSYQTGQGIAKAVELPMRIENTAVKNRKLAWVGCGKGFSVLACPA